MEQEVATMAGVIEVNAASFEREVLESEHPVLVDFWAPHWSACRAIGPIVEELAAEYQGRLKVAKVNTDENFELLARYGVRAIPNLLIIRQRQVRQQIVGAVAKRRLVSAIEEALASWRAAGETLGVPPASRS
jgi:thioredoxin